MSRWWLEGGSVASGCLGLASLQIVALPEPHRPLFGVLLFLVNANRHTVSEKVAVLYFCAVSQVAVLKCFVIFPVFIEFQNSSEKNVK